ncbi:hypothetical protein RB595_001857 [Gaeumannomyces hyphopodioides]
MIYALIFTLVVFGMLKQRFSGKKRSTAPETRPATPSADRLGEDVTSDGVAQPRVKWAVLIGIDRYAYKDSQKNRKRVSVSGHELTGPGNLRGCVNDALGVREYLIETMKMDPSNIKLLLAPVETDGRDYKFALPDKSEYKEPTYANIVKTLAEVTSYAKQNHLVFVHYSGHGGQATTVFADLKKKSSDAVDHSLMPADIARTGRYLRDVELGALLQDIVAVGAVLTVVLDCCHSGGAIRGDDDADDDADDEGLASVRGEAMVCRSHETRDRKLAPESEASIARWGSVPLWMDEPKGFVLLAACLDYQRAKERREILRGDGGSNRDREFWHGHLTYGLLDTLRTCAPGLSSTTMYERLRSKVQNAISSQTPYLIGDSDRFFFGPAHRPRVYAVPVQSVENKKWVKLAGGRFHGVQMGAEYLIMPLDFKLDRRVRTKDVLARVRIQEVQAGTSTAEILDDPPASPDVGEGCPAVLRCLPLDAQATVRFTSTDSGRKKSFEDLWNKHAKARKLLRLLKEEDAGGDPMFNVAVKGGYFQVRDRQGALTSAVTRQLGRLRSDGGVGVHRLAQRLEHVARYHMLRGLENQGCRADGFQNLVDVQVTPSSEDVELNNGEVFRAAKDIECRHGVYEVPEKRLFRITMTNKTGRRLAVTILNFTPELGISVIYPSSTNYGVIHGSSPDGEEGRVYDDFFVEIPKALRQTADEKTGDKAAKQKGIVELFKVLVSTSDLDPGQIQLAKLHQAEKEGHGCRSEEADGEDTSPNTLEDLLSKLMPPTRDGHSISSKGRMDDGNEWQAKDIYIRVLPSS